MSKSVVHKCALGGDHAGYEMKTLVAEYLKKLSIEVIDCGAHDESPSDFPVFGEKVGRLVLDGTVERGILVCGSGVGVSVAANKIPGIRASLCHDTYSAHQGVEHDDMNVLCIGARVIGQNLAMEIIDSFLGAEYTPLPRHRKRVDMILDIEKRALNGEFGTEK